MPRIPSEQRLKRSQESHEQRHPLTAAEGVQPRRESRRQLGSPDGASKSPNGGARAVGGQFQDWRAALQLPSPVGQLPGQRVTLEPLALPARELCVLHGELGQG